MSEKVNISKRKDILTAAGKLYAQFGLQRTSMIDIARYARVSKKTIYNYFSSKDELFKEVVHQESETLIQHIRGAMERETTTRGKIQTYIISKISKIRELLNFYNVTRETIFEFWPHVDGIRESYREMEKNIILDVLLEGIKNNEVAVPDPELTAEAIVLSLRGLESPWLNEDKNFNLEEGIEKLMDILFYGILKR